MADQGFVSVRAVTVAEFGKIVVCPECGALMLWEGHSTGTHFEWHQREPNDSGTDDGSA